MEKSRVKACFVGDLDVLTGMEALVDHNMLVQKKTARDLRFGMLETIREYALERFNESKDAATIRKQHVCSSYFLPSSYIIFK